MRFEPLRGRLATLAIAVVLVCSTDVAFVSPSSTLATAAHPGSTDTDGDGLTDNFEKNRSRTNPFLADTDHDGISDGREDPDRDGLDNRWEQRLKLNPLARDSDRDGIPDGREDNDHDGLSNVFEIRGKVTDPRTNDTDGDGVRDSAEDPDGDLLSNRGELRWGTNPGNADTDGDGVNDGAEDANLNGLANAAEQDVRQVPTHLVPSLADALSDVPITSLDGCNVGTLEHEYRHCTYGNPTATVRVALFGDSHIGDWFPAVYTVAQARGWRVDNYTRSACPWPDVKTFNAQQGVIDADCASFRTQALADLAMDPPTLVVMSSLVAYQLYDANDQPIPSADFESTWDAGMARSLAALPAGTLKLVLEDTPLPWTVNVPQCLMAHPASIAVCEGSRSAWINSPHADAERATATANGARFASLNDKFCPYDPCGVVFDEMVAFRDNSHVTATV